MEQATRSRSGWLLGFLTLIALAIVAKAFVVQVLEEDEWQTRAQSQILREIELPAMRGTISDRNGTPLALSGVRYEVAVAPREVSRSLRSSLVDSLVSVLEIDRRRALSLVDTTSSWKVAPGRYGAEERERLRSIRGVHFTPLIRRAYPQGGTTLPIVGRITADGRILGGIELAYDTLLSGKPGRRTVYRDVRGRQHQANADDDRQPVAGINVRLSLDSDLQQVAAAILQSQIDSTGAQSGDVVIVSTRTGDILAMVGRTSHGTETLSPISSPYEPGSVMKPFTYAGLLEQKLISLDDSVYAEKGRAVVDGRSISDSHPYEWLTYREALAVSSNIALVKAVRNLSDTTQYELLKGFGFGRSTGFGVGPESAGLLRPPHQWSKFSRGSLAIGYEINATPLQIAMAYAALANRGLLMQPRLVIGEQRAGGEWTHHDPSEVGQAVSQAVADEIMLALRDVIEEGSGRAADLGTFTVAGKTGTSRAWGEGGYDGYYASFAALFPAIDPQLAIVVRISRPSRGSYYGGSVAGPVVRRTLEAMLSSATPPIDRAALAQGRVADAITAPAPFRVPDFTWRGARSTTAIQHPKSEH